MADTETNTSIPVLVHLSGPNRGEAVRLSGARIPLSVQPGREAGVRPSTTSPIVATLEPRGQHYQLTAQDEAKVWVNGERISQLVLASGDVIELGSGGPVLRFRVHSADYKGYKALRDVFSDCWACAQYHDGGVWSQAKVLLGGIPMELATRTTLAFRLTVAAVLVGLVITVFAQGRQNNQLADTLDRDRADLASLASQMAESQQNPSTPGSMLAVLREVRDSLTQASERLGALETRSGAAARVIAMASRSTVFLLGAYGFVEPNSGKPLRFTLGPDSTVIRSAGGDPAITLDGEGPLFEVLYTGTGFVVSGDGLVITNRHVALPWESEGAAAELIKKGYTPVMRRFGTYAPEIPHGLGAKLLGTSETADLAVIQIVGLASKVPPLALDDHPPQPGDQVLVLGYPLGIRALMARTDATVVSRLLQEPDLDFWQAAERLGSGGYISPLASQGIVGQVTTQAIVYDAETTHGGSGGPVMSLDGKVVAVNSAILPEFGGSNLGVPVASVRALLAEITIPVK